MEAAGLAVADEAARLARARGRIVVLCGPGDNGGDGFVAARLLAERGYPVDLGLLGRREALAGDAAARRGPLRRRGPPGRRGRPRRRGLRRSTRCSARGSRATSRARRARSSSGSTPIARAGGRVLAVDTPSGVDGATGQVRGVAVEARASVTFFRLKPGHLLEPGRVALRRRSASPTSASRRACSPASRPTPSSTRRRLWRGALPRLEARSHKYARGAALVLSGPAHQTGAARLAARAALRAGAGIVALASPPEAVAVNAAHVTAVMVAPFSGAARLRGAARRRAAARGRARPRRGRRAGDCASSSRRR